MTCCPFRVPDSWPACQVIRSLAVTAVPWSWEQVATDYCRRGTFISCPIFTRVERYLSAHHRRSSAPTVMHDRSG